MIIALPMDENKKDICVSFGRAPFFMFYDTETEKYEIKVNPAAVAEGGAGLKAAQCVADNNADILITPRCGENAAEVFEVAEIKIFKSQGTDALENVKLFKEEKLEKLTKFHGGFHGIH